MKLRLMAVVSAAAVAAGGPASTVDAGGKNPEAVIAVGATKHWVEIDLPRRVAESLYSGTPIRTPRGPFVRLYPMFFGLPGAPARFFPARGVVCFDPPPQTACRQVPAQVRGTLRPAARLPLRTSAAPSAKYVAIGSRRVRLPNLLTALELAFDRPGVPSAACAAKPRFRIVWTTAAGGARPERAALGQDGIHADGRLFALPRSSVEYIRANLSR